MKHEDLELFEHHKYIFYLESKGVVFRLNRLEGWTAE